MRMAKVIGITIVLVLGIAASGVAYYLYSQTQLPETLTVERQTVEQIVEFKGHVEAQQTAKLGFDRSGIVSEVNVQVGDFIEAGIALATIDTQISKLEQDKAFAQRVQETTNAKIALENARDALGKNQAEGAQQITAAEQAVKDAQAEVVQAKAVWQQTVDEEDEDSVEAETAYAAVLAAETVYRTKQEALKNTRKTTQTTEAATVASVRDAEAVYGAAVQASATVAGLSTLEVNEAIARAQLSKNTLFAPMSGTVTTRTIEVGEVAVAGEPVLTIQSTNQKEIVADVDEVDIPKITVGSTARVTFDAYPAEEWKAEVVKIDPVGIIEDEDDVTYEVTLRLAQDEARLLPALTARIEIETAKRENVVAVPHLAIEYMGSQTFVYLVTARRNHERREVEVGVTGTNGLVEVVKGLQAGDRVLRRPLNAI